MASGWMANTLCFNDLLLLICIELLLFFWSSWCKRLVTLSLCHSIGCTVKQALPSSDLSLSSEPINSGFHAGFNFFLALSAITDDFANIVFLIFNFCEEYTLRLTRLLSINPVHLKTLIFTCTIHFISHLKVFKE